MSKQKTKQQKLIDLTNRWYSKLKKSGFQDIEFYDDRTGKGQNSDYLVKTPLNLRTTYRPETEEFYAICRNFCTHFQFPTKKERLIFEMYSEGVTYRDILKKLSRTQRLWVYRTNGKPRLSLFTLHRLIHKYIKICVDWDRTNPEGLTYSRENPD